jgi:penicillin-binding protein 1A
MGIGTPISTNPAMTIGGLSVGVTPLDMAHAYETIAHGGDRVSGSLASASGEPVGIGYVASGSRLLPDGHHTDVNRVRLHRVLPNPIATTETQMLETVLQFGTARAAAIGQFAAGKTGTTSNYGDAWFVGWDSRYTVAVWVGYPNGLVPMKTQFNGGPVLGGTFPALIWHDFMVSAMHIERERASQHQSSRASSQAAVTPAAGGQPSSSAGTAASHAPHTVSHAKAQAPSHTETAPAVKSQPSSPTSAPSSPTSPPSPAPPPQTPTPPESGAPSTPGSPGTGGAAAPTGPVSPGR